MVTKRPHSKKGEGPNSTLFYPISFHLSSTLCNRIKTSPKRDTIYLFILELSEAWLYFFVMGQWEMLNTKGGKKKLKNQIELWEPPITHFENELNKYTLIKKLKNVN